MGAYGVDHSMIIKSYTTDLDAIQVTPERNWRGTAARIFFKPPSGLSPRTFTMTGVENKAKVIVRASARNTQGLGPFSNSLAITPSSTVPGLTVSGLTATDSKLVKPSITMLPAANKQTKKLDDTINFISI